jgi:hypothetical protein
MFVPISTSETYFVTDRYDLAPEGMAVDPRDGSVYFGSMRHGDIFVIDPQGGLSLFAHAESKPPMSVLGLEVDTIRNLLWAAGLTYYAHVDHNPDEPAATAVFGFDLADGHQVHQYRWSGPGEIDGFNDLTVTRSGDIYIGGSGVFKILAGDSIPVRLSASQPVTGVNGLTLSDDEHLLFVSDYPSGIIRLELQSGDCTYLTAPDSVELLGFDGLYFHEGALVGLQNGLSPWRAVKLELNDDYTAVTGMEIMEFKNDAIAAGMTGGIYSDWLYYVGRGTRPEHVAAHIPRNVRVFMGRTYIMKASIP